MYVLGLSLVGLWQHPVDGKVDVVGQPLVQWMTGALGLTPVEGYNIVQFAANVLLFVPFGVLVMLMWRRATVLRATAVGAAVAVLIELLQLLVRPERLASLQDVVANTFGAAVGAAAVWVVRSRRRVAGG